MTDAAHLTDDHALLRHEALDRVHVLAEGLGQNVIDHPFLVSRPDLTVLADRAAEALADLYQAIGAATVGDPELAAA